eukprot:TRINITY_DN628_c0_g1_i1.p1 TRINITY_DN628_c0_g1~~TRINITY_DN628_c0_g1_i1.p1  ORF type:complete len:633 (+),score=138.85 TRINITY_DN628_c0_g1_i1:536-2434(+)
MQQLRSSNGSRKRGGQEKKDVEIHLGCVYEDDCLVGNPLECPQKEIQSDKTNQREKKRNSNEGGGYAAGLYLSSQEEPDEFLPPPKSNQIQYSSYLESNSDRKGDRTESSNEKGNSLGDSGDGNRRSNTPSAGPISCSTLIEAPELGSSSVHKFWGMVKLEHMDFNSHYSSFSSSTSSSVPIDFIVVIDRSSSMKMDNKLAFLQATIEYLIHQLSPCHRFGLLTFNQEVTMITPGLLEMNADNKMQVSDLLKQIKAEGSTNISDALLTAIGILNSRDPSEQHRASSIMLFTDGLANIGLRGCRFLKQMKDIPLPPGLSINTFGYGLDHDSQMLQSISMSSEGGVYYYIETVDCIASTFGECLAGLLSTVVHNVRVQLVGEDGCRIVSFYTKYPVSELKNVKDYKISLGSLYKQESKTILFKLSIRKSEEVSKQKLLRVIIGYTDTITGLEHQTEKTICVNRPSRPNLYPIPTELDKHINRYAAAAAIEEAVHKASGKDFFGAKKQIEDVITSIKSSLSSKEGNSSYYCQDLVKDLMECLFGMKEEQIFHYGIHYAHAYSTMYYMERSTGTRNLIGIQNIAGKDAGSILSSPTQDVHYNVGSGYLTSAQVEESFRAQTVARSFVTGYMENVFS